MLEINIAYVGLTSAQYEPGIFFNYQIQIVSLCWHNIEKDRCLKLEIAVT